MLNQKKPYRSPDPLTAVLNAGLDALERAIARGVAKVVRPKKQRKR
jgi:hypothetical protein